LTEYYLGRYDMETFWEGTQSDTYGLIDVECHYCILVACLSVPHYFLSLFTLLLLMN